MTRGIDLNNPMNLMESEINWAFQIKPTRDPKGFLAQFRSMPDGLRAGMKNLLNQQLLHGLRCWAMIMPRYAPPPQNNVEAYIKDMCASTDVAPMQNFDLTNKAFLVKATKAIIRHEQGENCCDDLMIGETADMLLGKKS